MKPNPNRTLHNLSKLLCLFLLGGAVSAQAAGVTWINTGTGNWSDSTKWTSNALATTSSPNAAGDLARPSAGGFTATLTGPVTMGVIVDSLGSAGAWGVAGAFTVTMDNTGAIANNSAGNLDSFIGQSSSGTLTFAAQNIIIANTDLDIANTGSTTPILSIGTLGTTTITATSPRNLFIRQNVASASGKAININSSIGSSGSVITVQNVGTSASAALMTLAGVVGPNASIVQNAATTRLRLSAVNTYSGSTTITLGTLVLGANNTIPSISSVDITGTLDMATFSDTIDALTGTGTVNNNTAGTPTLTVGGNNSSGTFSGVIQNTLGTLSFGKTGSGTETLTGGNTYAGTTTFTGGFLNAGSADSPGSSGPFGSATAAGSMVFNGGTLQYSAANQQDYSSRFSTAANQAISIDTAGQAITFATALTSSGGSLTLTNSTGAGTLTLTTAETYTGNTTVNGGVLALSGSAALAAASTINIGAGGSFDVSALASPYTIGGSASLKARGNGTSIGTTAANVVAASGGIFDLGSQPVSLTWGGASSGTDSTHPALLVSQGTLNLNNNTITVLVPGTALSAGVYTLISTPAITGTPNATPSFTGGNGLAVGNVGVVSVSGSTVILTVTASGGVVGTWNVDADGNWTDGSKWSSNPNVPHAAGDAATLGVGSVLRTVTLNANETIGSLSLTNSNSFVIANAGNTLTLDNLGAGVPINVTDGSANTIQTAVALNDNTVVTIGSGKSLAVSSIISNKTTAKTLTFSAAGTAVLSGANTYGPAAGSVGTTFSGGGTLQVGNNTALAAGDVSVSGNSTLKAGAAVSLANNIALSDLTTVDNNGNNLTLGGIVSGAGGITKNSNGTLTLNGVNTYTGDTKVNAGTVSVSADANFGAVGANKVILNGGALVGSATFALDAGRNIGVGPASGGAGTNALISVASGQAFTINGVIASAGNGGVNSLTVNSGAGNNGTLILGGANTFNGSTVISNGVLQLANSGALQNSGLNYNLGTLLFDGSISAATLGGFNCVISSRSLALTNILGNPVALTVGGNNAAVVFGGNLTDAGSLIKAGTGTLTVSNANYTGGTTINTGSGAATILAGTFGSSSSPITIGANFTLPAGTATASAFNVAVTGGQTGVGATINGTANLTNTSTTIGSSGNTAGATTINSAGNVNLGAVKVNKDGGGTGSGLIIAGGNVIATSVNIGQTGTAARAADLNITGGTFTIADASQTGMFAVHCGAGNGTMTVSGGTLNYLGTDGLLMSIGGGPSVANLTGGTANLTGITLNSGSAATTSTLFIGGTNNPALYLGSVGLIINLPSATVAATFGNGTIGALTDWVSDAPITLTNNPILKTADAANVAHSIILSNVLSGVGGFTKIGAGTLTLRGASTYTGNTVVSNTVLALVTNEVTGVDAGISNSAAIYISAGATLDVTGRSDGTFPLGTDVSNQTLGGNGTINGKLFVGALGTVSPGFSIGTLTVNNNVTLAGTALMELNRAASPNSDRITAPVINAGGTLTVTNIGAALHVGDSFQLFSTPVTGAFTVTNFVPDYANNVAYTWTNKLAIDGTIAILSLVSLVNTNVTAITNSYDGSNLTLAWPTDHIGWRLQVQTNSLATGLATNWSTVAGSSTTNQMIIPVNAANGSVFYRLVYP